VLRLLVGVFAFWEMPGYTLEEALSAINNLTATIGFPTGIAFESDDLLSSHRAANAVRAELLNTAASAVLLAGAVLLAFMILFNKVIVDGVLDILLDGLMRCMALCMRAEAGLVRHRHQGADVNGWPPLLPEFRDVIHKDGFATSDRVRLRDEEETILISDVVDEKGWCCSNRLLHGMWHWRRYLLQSFGLSLWRPRVSAEEFESLPRKPMLLRGEGNISYGPEFNTRYTRAFRYVEKMEREERERTSRQQGRLPLAPQRGAAGSRAAPLMSTVPVVSDAAAPAAEMPNEDHSSSARESYRDVIRGRSYRRRLLDALVVDEHSEREGYSSERLSQLAGRFDSRATTHDRYSQSLVSERL